MATTKNLYQRIAEVQAQIGYIEKDGTNKGVGYKYVSEAALVAKLKEYLIVAGLALIFKSGKPYTVREYERIKKDYKTGEEISRSIVAITGVDCEMLIVNTDNTSESIVITGSGYGEDTADKGPYKAITGANKYMLFKLFQVPTGDDPEKDKKDRKGQASPHSFDPEEEEEDDGDDHGRKITLEDQEESFENFRKQISNAKLQEELDSISKAIAESLKGGFINKTHRLELLNQWTACKALIKTGE
jgi:hypothetical protein